MKKSIVIVSLFLFLCARSSYAQFNFNTDDGPRPFPDTVAGFHPHLFLSLGIGIVSPSRSIPLTIPHYELTGGMSFLGRLECVYRFEHSILADPYGYQNLTYSSGISIHSVALRYYFLERFFASAAGGIALGTTDSAFNAPLREKFGEATFSTPVVSAGVGFAYELFYFEFREYVGTNRIEAYGGKSVTFMEGTFGFGLFFRS
jgi:hypothetical protein